MKIDKEDIRAAFEILEGEMQWDVDSRLIGYAPEYKGEQKKEEAEGDGQ